MPAQIQVRIATIPREINGIISNLGVDTGSTDDGVGRISLTLHCYLQFGEERLKVGLVDLCFAHGIDVDLKGTERG